MSTSPATSTTVVSSAAARSKIENPPLASMRYAGSARTGVAETSGRSVLRWVFRHPRHEGVLATLSLQHRRPQFLRRLAEHVARLGGLDDPVVALELAVELTGSPSGIAREHANIAGAVDHVGQLAKARDQ